jgi:hypothetical protein
MHLLGHHLVELGYEAYLHTPWINEKLRAPQLTDAVVRQHENEGRTPIVMYSETLWGNPLRADCIVRYAGNFLGLLGGPEAFPADQLMVWHSLDLAGDLRKDPDTLVLSVPTTDTSIFYPPSEPAERTLTSYYASKLQDFFGARAADYFNLPDDCIEISRSPVHAQTPAEVADIFRRSKVFYAFENTTLSLEAMLCGCPVQLVPNPYFTQPLDVEPVGRRGMAWGFDPDEQRRALETLSEVPGAFSEVRRRFFSDLDRFARRSQKHSIEHTQTRKLRLIQPYDFYTASDSKFDRIRVTFSSLWSLYGFRAIPLFTEALWSAKSWKRAKTTFRVIEMAPGILEFRGEAAAAADRLFQDKLRSP